MREFNNYHPIVTLVYFATVIGFSMFFLHPVCIGISLVSALITLGILKGIRQIFQNIIWMVVFVVFGAAFNGIFNHQGATVICYFPDGNPLTLESIIYGGAATSMIVCVICWFSCMSVLLTSERIMYLFGRILPTFALIFSMILWLAEKFKRHLTEVSTAQKSFIPDTLNHSKIKSLKDVMTIFLVGMSGMLEDSIETANSMRARGYGLKGRTAFSLFRFEKRDGVLLILMVVLAILVGTDRNSFRFECFPVVKMQSITINSVLTCIWYFLILAIPIFIELWGEIKWKFLK